MEHKVTETELAAAAVAPRVTLADLESEIAYVGYFTALEGVNAGGALTMTKHASDALRLLTFAVVVMRNGFTVTGQSACASPENFNAEIGQRLALDDAKRQIWPLLGFRLRDRLAEVPASLKWSYAPDVGVWTAKRGGWEYELILRGGYWWASLNGGHLATFSLWHDAQAACETHAAQVLA